MIYSLKGKILDIGNRYLVIENNGIGYKVGITDDTIHNISIGQNIELFTHLAVREDALDLYGFTNKKDRNLFELLISISGIGPKTALNILSLIMSEMLIKAIRNGSTSQLVKISGIGRKTAEKILIELKDKLGGVHIDEESELNVNSDIDTIEALKALGYSAEEAREALRDIDKEITDTGKKVKAALKILSK
jgi:Holliday junction DNA helicase RuvA